MSLPSLAILSLLCLLAAAEVSASGAAEFFVSKTGSNSWSGKLSAPNKSKTDGPFATIEHARDAVRALKDAKTPATVHLRKGVYFLNETFVLGPQDTHPITFAAYKGEKATVSGGRPIAGFKPVEVNGIKMLAAEIPDVKDGKWSFTQLFVNDRRRPRTRLPKKDYYRVVDLPGVPEKLSWGQGQDKFQFAPDEIKASWRNLGDIDVISLALWIESRMQIKSVDDAAHIVNLNKPSVVWMWDDFQAKTGGRYWVENVFEALDTPGQWYLDRPTGTLYYYPFAGEDTRTLRVIAPKLEQLVRVGDGLAEGQNLSGIKFENLRFAHTEPVHPTERGGYSQAAHGVSGAIHFERASDCAVTNCDIFSIGTYGVEIGNGCKGVRVERNRIVDLGAGGVKVGHGSDGTLVADNDIGDGGKIFMSGEGVWIGNSGNNQVIHNNIYDLGYTGVSVGWTWGYGESKAVNNIIEYNHIHDIGRGVLSDMGGIYTLGISPGTKLRNNLIHDCSSYSYGGWGIYTDEGSSNILIENNVVYNTKTGGFHQHYGKENILRNNIFAFATDQQIQRTRMEEHTSFFFEHNIVYYDTGVLLGSNWKDDKYVIDYNCYWDASGKPVTFAEGSFEEWKKRAHDEHSIIADPLFVNANKRDFTLKTDSPAFKLGFKPIDISTVGPRCPIGPR